MLLKYVVASFNPNEVDQDSDTKMLKQYLYTAGFCMSGFLWILVQFHAIFEVRHMGMKWRLAISSMIYRKVNNSHTTLVLITYTNMRLVVICTGIGSSFKPSIE